MKKHEPKYCIVLGSLHTREWNKDDFDENDDSESEMDLIEPVNNKYINFDNFINGVGYGDSYV